MGMGYPGVRYVCFILACNSRYEGLSLTVRLDDGWPHLITALSSTFFWGADISSREDNALRASCKHSPRR